MKIGLLIIASEVLDGKITDLNTRFLAEFLRDHHLELNSSLVVRDIEEEIIQGINTLYQSCQLVITSGGLGPTKDDLTKNVLCKYFNKTLSYSSEAQNVAEENYRRMNRCFPGKDHGYSYLPEGFLALSNTTGFAPGLYFEEGERYLLSAPGVPREFRSIIQDHLSEWIQLSIKNQALMEHIIFRTRRIPEEKIFGEVDPELWKKLEAFGDVSSLPILMGVDIGVKIRAANTDELNAQKEAILRIMDESPVSSSIWHIGPEKLEEVIVSKAGARKFTFGFAESCTGGLCSQRITNVPGSSRSFKGSVVCYDTAVKTQLLKVPEQVINQYGVVSVQTAEAMAKGLAEVLEVDFAVSTTGIAGPGGGSEQTPVGTVCIGIFAEGKVESHQLCLFGDREQLKERFAQAALMSLLESMEKSS